MKSAKTTPENDNISKDEDVKEVNTKINNLNTIIEKETKARRFLGHVSKQMFSQLESKMTDIATKNSDPDFENLEKKVSILESTTTELKEQLTHQPDLEVATHDKIIMIAPPIRYRTLNKNLRCNQKINIHQLKFKAASQNGQASHRYLKLILQKKLR